MEKFKSPKAPYRVDDTVLCICYRLLYCVHYFITFYWNTNVHGVFHIDMYSDHNFVMMALRNRKHTHTHTRVQTRLSRSLSVCANKCKR